MIFHKWLPFGSSRKNICLEDIKRFLSASDLEPRTLVGCGNPLLDITARVDDKFLEKYDLKKNTAVMADKSHSMLYKDLIKNYEVKYTAGGAVLSALRAYQWILERPNISVVFGCVGKDEHAEILKNIATEAGVEVRFQYTSNAPTGKCAALITALDRTLVANIGAAEHFTIEHLDKEENHPIIENAKFFYISGYFLVVSIESVMKLAELATQQNSYFVFNLSSDFVVNIFMPLVQKILPYVDILFANELEMDAFAQKQNWNVTDRKEIGRRLQRLYKKNSDRPRIVIITQGHLPVIMVQENSVIEFELPKIQKSDIVDTNGAGDCFVGGFLSQYMLGKSLEECICCGIYCAQYVIRQNGVIFVGRHQYKE